MTRAALFRSACLALALAALPAAVAAAQPGPPEPYRDPPWRAQCTWHRYGEGDAPPLGSLTDQPRCVRYSKKDITVDNGGAVKFLAAEPERFAAAGDACRYWQRDHWSAQVSTGTPAVVTWRGSYWWDRSTGEFAAILRRFRVGGEPIGAGRAADLVEQVNPAWADTIRTYGGHGAVGGRQLFGYGDPICAGYADPP